MKLVPLNRSESGNPRGDSKSNPSVPTLYTCPMASHADVVSDQPGKCPKCDMDLVPTSTVKHGKIAEENWRKEHELQH